MSDNLTGKLIFLGTGTSYGVPHPCCDCQVCKSNDPKDDRCRQSAIIYFSNGTVILIDCGTDIRKQLIRQKVKKIDYVIMTHDHSDHIQGVGDLSVLCQTQNIDIPFYMNENTMDTIVKRFGYLRDKHPGLSFHLIDEKPFKLGGIPILPIPLMHATDLIFGFRFGDLAYCTDTNSVPDKSNKLLKGVKILVIDGLRPTTHRSHFSFEEAIDIIQIVKPKEAYIIHICHSLKHEEIEKYIQEQKEIKNITDIEIHPAYDGLALNEFNVY